MFVEVDHLHVCGVVLGAERQAAISRMGKFW